MNKSKYFPGGSAHRCTGEVARGNDEAESRVSYYHVYESALYNSYPWTLQLHGVSLLISLMSRYHTSIDRGFMSNFAESYAHEASKRFMRTLFPMRIDVLVVLRARVARLPRSDLTSPSALQPLWSRMGRGARLPGAGARLCSHCRRFLLMSRRDDADRR